MTDTRADHYKAVRKVLWQVLAANLSVTLLKITLGLFTGALALVADGFHSLVDSSSNLIGLAAIRLANRPADEKHPYGYRRYETLGAMAIGGMLLIAGYEIGEAIVERIINNTQPMLTNLVLVLVALTFPVNLLIYTLERRAGRRLGSEILLADAAHTRADLFVTASVFAGMIGVWMGLPWLDILIAGGVLVLIGRAAYGILRSSASWLTDAMAIDPGQVESIALGVPGVQYVHEIRSRGSPDAAFVDLHVKVYPEMSTEQAHAIASEVENQIRSQIPNVVDALVHIEPALEESATRWERIAYDLRQIAGGLGLGLHDLHVHNNNKGGVSIEVHLEMDGDISLGKAHDLAEQFETRVMEQSTRPNTVITHLEPLPGHVLQPDHEELHPDLEAEIRTALSDHIGSDNLLELRTYRFGEHAGIAVRLSMPAESSLTEAHNRAEHIERELLVQFPDLNRVVVHVEPEIAP